MHGDPFSLSAGCYLTFTGTAPGSGSTFYPIAVMLEDYYPSAPTVKMSSAPLQFVVEVGAASGSPCTAVTPLLVDQCSANLAPLSACPTTITVPSNAHLTASSYSVTPNSTASYSCDYGYEASTTPLFEICTAIRFANEAISFTVPQLAL